MFMHWPCTTERKVLDNFYSVLCILQTAWENNMTLVINFHYDIYVALYMYICALRTYMLEEILVIIKVIM